MPTIVEGVGEGRCNIGDRYGPFERQVFLSVASKTVSVSPHIFLHSVAVHMAEAGIKMEVIAQYLAHEDINVMRGKLRTLFAYLREAAAAIEYDDLALSGSMNLKEQYLNSPQVLDLMVGATGIEPVTPTMSR
jgi:hypothetical protein